MFGYVCINIGVDGEREMGIRNDQAVILHVINQTIETVPWLGVGQDHLVYERA